MSSSHPSFAIPRRLTLSSQAAETLRTAIAEGTWQDFLPSERRLCEMFQISRPTIRTALHLLAKDGLIEIRQGRRNRLISSTRKKARKESRLVGLIMSQPASRMSSLAYQGISDMRAHLTEQGFATEILICRSGNARTQQRKLGEFMRQNRLFCCVLFAMGKEIQEWFFTRSLPALVLGSCHPEVKLPSLDIDHRSVCRHGVGHFLSRGHRRLALVIPDTGFAGDLASEQGFREAIEQHPASERVHATVVRHDGSARHIGTKLDALFNATEPPTALLVAKTPYVFVVLMYLLKRGLAVPDCVSFIARDQDLIFETVNPPIAHYSVANDAYAHRLSRLMLQMVTRGYLAPEPNLIFPKFFPGGTIKRLR